MLTYDAFLANVTESDLRILTLVAHKQAIQTQSQVEADQYKADLSRLLTNKLVRQARQTWEWVGTDIDTAQLWQSFDAVIEPLAVAYMTRMAMERIKINRTPLP